MADELKVAGTRTLARGLAVLDCFSDAASTLSIQQVARSIGLPKSTTFRLVHTLEASGFLIRRGAQEYALSSKFGQLAAIAQRGSPVIDAARPVMEGIPKSQRQGVSLHTVEDHRRVCLDAVGDAEALSYMRPSPNSRALGLGGASLTLMASMDGDDLDTALPSASQVSRCPIDELRSIVDIARRQGYAVSHGGGVAGVTGVAAPIDSGAHRARHCVAMVIPTPEARGHVVEMIDQVLSAASRISNSLR